MKLLGERYTRTAQDLLPVKILKKLDIRLMDFIFCGLILKQLKLPTAL